jgi:two-component system response regulator GlrR
VQLDLVDDRSQQTPISQRQEGSNMNVLIVDDDVLLARALARALSKLGHACRTATSVDSAVSLVALHRPGLVLTDLDLGGAGDGIDLACWLRHAEISVPIVIMTGSDVELTRVELARAGLDEIDVLAKPFPLRRLLALLAERHLQGTRGPGAPPPGKDAWS